MYSAGLYGIYQGHRVTANTDLQVDYRPIWLGLRYVVLQIPASQ